ncbi:hypothetical protein [Desulfocurvus sp.]|jgi:transcription elongation factor Elf1|uniref:hypothetical protein n=1 Tax=Desulfocurvus sp. TaxID=2871698 RepID=UPI0025BF9584|nr:hypothetical protein [Desulfocurvus sp.]MCK9240739.1 hypothetical protein [Desulfocurvus sp.]
MSPKTYTVQGTCPGCGHDTTLALEAKDMKALDGSRAKALAPGQEHLALAHCPHCGQDYPAPISPDTCAEWDDFCREIHPIQEV